MDSTTENTQSLTEQPASNDVLEAVGSVLAVRSHVGSSKSRNEDYGSVAEETVNGVTYSIMLVADGVSTAATPDVAARLACQAAREAIAAQLKLCAAPLEAVKSGIAAAQKAVSNIPPIAAAKPGKKVRVAQAAFIAAVVGGGKAAIGWIGDCRAYLLPGSGAKLLTKDHSWINVFVAAGMSVLNALNTKQAHWITRCLGKLEDGLELEPDYLEVELNDASLIFLCSDGFWNYGHPRQDQRATPLLDQVRALPDDADASTIANRFVEFANESGGHDNITVAVLKLQSKSAESCS